MLALSRQHNFLHIREPTMSYHEPKKEVSGTIDLGHEKQEQFQKTMRRGLESPPHDDRTALEGLRAPGSGGRSCYNTLGTCVNPKLQVECDLHVQVTHFSKFKRSIVTVVGL